MTETTPAPQRTEETRKGAPMREFHRVITEHVQAVQITDSTFDAPHPNPEHVIGVTYDPVRRQVSVPVNGYGDTLEARVGDWIVRFPGEEYMAVIRGEDFNFMPDALLPEEWAALKRLAQEATPSDWKWSPEEYAIVARDEDGETVRIGEPQYAADIDYIVEAQPATVLRLLAAFEKALRALRSPADRIAELEARVGTLSVALEMARSPAPAESAAPDHVEGCDPDVPEQTPGCPGCEWDAANPALPATASPPPVAREAGEHAGPSLEEIAQKADAYAKHLGSVEGLRGALEIVAQNVRDALARESAKESK